jgi:hypothetical protein
MQAIQDQATTTTSSARRLAVVPGVGERTQPMRTIARYDDYRRALAAVTELCEHGARPRGLHLASTEFETVQVRADSDLQHEAGRAIGPALLGAAGLAVAGAVAGAVELSAPLWLLVVTVVAVAAVAAGAIALWRGRGDGLPVAKERLVPVAYELRCLPADADDAERHLAGWWKTGLDGPPRSGGGRRIVGR